MTAPTGPGGHPRLAALRAAMGSRRTAAVALLAFSSGLPLGVVWIAIPDWLRSIGVDIRVVGMITLAQAPWTFKFLWAPLLDRYPLRWIGRRRGWIAVTQVALLALLLALAGVGGHPDAPWVVGALAFAIALASATHDIAYDAYTVDVLRREEQAMAVGVRTAIYMTAYRALPGLGIWLASRWSWPAVNAVLASVYLPMLVVTVWSPEPPGIPARPSTLREAVWRPFVGFLARHRALEILAFVLLYKFADNLATSLVRPFLVDAGYDAFDRGVALTTVGWGAVVAGTLLGGAATALLGLGHSLWLFGFLQIFSNIGYVLVARLPVNRPLMYAATGFDSLTQGLATAAFSVFLLRLTQKRFSATQYALYSSLFGLPRVLTGPITGFTVNAIGWEGFFWTTLLAGIPGLVLLQRFAPIGRRELHIDPEPPPRPGAPLGPRALWVRGLAGAAVALALGLLALAAVARPVGGFGAAVTRVLRPTEVGDWVRLTGAGVFAAMAGLLTAALAAARRGGGEPPEEEGP